MLWVTPHPIFAYRGIHTTPTTFKKKLGKHKSQKRNSRCGCAAVLIFLAAAAAGGGGGGGRRWGVGN